MIPARGPNPREPRTRGTKSVARRSGPCAARPALAAAVHDRRSARGVASTQSKITDPKQAHIAADCPTAMASANEAPTRNRLREAHHLIIERKLVLVCTGQSTLVDVNLSAREQRLLVPQHALTLKTGEDKG
jgi:hypothetical protein